MQEAIFRGDLDSVIELSQGADLNEQLMRACITPHIHIATWLLDNGATNLDDGLAMAASSNQIIMMELLANRGANDWDFAMRTTLFDESTVEVLDWLVAHGATNWEWYVSAAVAGGVLENIRWLAHQDMGNSYMILCDAVEVGNDNIAAWLFASGIMYLNAALISARDDNDDIMVAWLLNHGATHVNADLLQNALNGNIERVAHALLHGATEIQNAAQIAARRQSWPILALLRNHVIDWTAIRAVSVEAAAWVDANV